VIRSGSEPHHVNAAPAPTSSLIEFTIIFLYDELIRSRIAVRLRFRLHQTDAAPAAPAPATLL
jgi:hypothetical protein